MFCSAGGDISAARALHDIAALTGVPGYALGQVSSAALPVFAACEPRIALPSAVFLWHEPSASDAGGRPSDLAIVAHDMFSWFGWACHVLGARTLRPAEEWAALGEGAGTQLGAEEALELGLVSAVVTQTVLDAPDARLERGESLHDGPGREGDGGPDEGQLDD